MTPSELMIGLVTPLCVYAVITVLHLVVPARTVKGYVTNEQGELLSYRLNGLRVHVITIALWAGVCWAGLLEWDFFYVHRWASLAGACTLGLIFTFAIVLPAPPTGRGLLADLFFGRHKNPQFLGHRIDAKMWLYLVGAIMLALNILSSAAFHLQHFGADANVGVVIYAALFLWFLSEYLFFEEVHLYTYDFVAERMGFKLGWGCLTFYPYFYAVGIFFLADAPDPDIHPAWRVLAVVVFFSGWALARGANMQKYTFKTRPQQPFLGITPEVLTGGGRSILVNGFWGLSRHVNYLGEVLMATGLAIALGYPLSIFPWLYPIYYVALLFPRQFDDDKRCAEKYGALWGEYQRRVPRRIIPGVW